MELSVSSVVAVNPPRLKNLPSGATTPVEHQLSDFCKYLYDIIRAVKFNPAENPVVRSYSPEIRNLSGPVSFV
jgi:hypothetical protein